MMARKLFLLLSVLAVVALDPISARVHADPKQAASTKKKAASIPPDVANVSYGPHERNVFDFWKAKSDRPTPLVIFFHGGGFTKGDKSKVAQQAPLEACLKNGMSVAAINYRYSTQARYPAPMADGARAVQFLRLHARDFNLNAKAFAATGGSAGAGISLWIGFHDDMADPKSDDPVARQSTRLSSMVVFNAQTTYDPRAIARLIGLETGRVYPLRLLFGVKEGQDPLQATELFKLYEDGSPVTHLTRDDPPVLLFYAHSDTPLPPEDTHIGIHHPRFGYLLKEKMDKLGTECIVRVKEDYEGKPAEQYQKDEIEFFLRHFPSGGEAESEVNRRDLLGLTRNAGAAGSAEGLSRPFPLLEFLASKHVRIEAPASLSSVLGTARGTTQPLQFLEER